VRKTSRKSKKYDSVSSFLKAKKYKELEEIKERIPNHDINNKKVMSKEERNELLKLFNDKNASITARLGALKKLNPLYSAFALEGNINAVWTTQWAEWTALQLASAHDHVKIVKFLLEAEADINSKDRSGNTALMLASLYGSSTVIKLLLKFGANVNDRNNDAETPLMLACISGDITTIRTLIKSGADLNAKDARNRTPLILACMIGRADIVKLLLEAGANVNETDDSGYTVLDRASISNNTEIIKLLEAYGAKRHYQITKS